MESDKENKEKNLEINRSKEVKEFFNESFIKPKKDSWKYDKRWEDLPFSHIARFNIVKITVSQKANSKLISIIIKYNII